VNDSDRRRRCDRVLQKASSHSLIDPLESAFCPPNQLVIEAL
jgi:hypothetical protein